MDDGKGVLINSISAFAVIALFFAGFGFFVYPNLEMSQEEEVLPASEVLSVVDRRNDYAYECPEDFRVVNVPSDYSSIQRAIDSVSGQAIIKVAAGSYSESIVLKPEICLIGGELGEVEIQGYSDTVIHAAGKNQIKNFRISSLGRAHSGVSVDGAEEVNIEYNVFENFKYAVLAQDFSSLSVHSNGFRDVDVGVFLENSDFFVEQNNIQDADVGLEISSSEGDIIGSVFEGGDYGIKVENSILFFNKNIFKNQTSAGMELCTLGDYEIGGNFFDNANEEILYK